MEQYDPSPASTLAVIIGASRFPHAPSIAAKRSFRRSAEAFHKYLISSKGLALSRDNLLSMFDSEKSANEMDEKLTDWLRTRTRALTMKGVAPRDLIIYYVGHGCFSSNGSDYALAIKRTRGDKLFYSSYNISLLSDTLRLEAGSLRKYLILDCCFSATAYSNFMTTGPLEVVRQKIAGELPAHEVQARRGTALLCASGPRDPAMAPSDLKYTMFSEALLKVLEQGDPGGGEFLNLVVLGELVRLRIIEAHPDDAVRPQVLSPEQTRGDVAQVPLFPNSGYRSDANNVPNEVVQLVTHGQNQNPLAIAVGMENRLADEQQYLTTGASFRPEMDKKELDTLGSELKSLAAGLRSLDFLLPVVGRYMKQKDLYSVACAVQVRPQESFFRPLLDCLFRLSETPGLLGFRLAVIYRAVMAIENIARTDNKRKRKTILPVDRDYMSRVLNRLRSHKRCKEDHTIYREKSLATRIMRALKVAKN